MKRVGQVANLAHLSIRQQHFDNVETNFHFGMFQEFQIIQTALRQQQSLAFVHGGGGAHPIFGGARFHFHEHEAVRTISSKD